jgi:hypothetical protein
MSATATPLRSIRPASGLSAPTTPLNSVDLPAPLGPTTAISAPGFDRAVEMVHRRMAVVAERQVAESQLRRHIRPFSAIAQKSPQPQERDRRSDNSEPLPADSRRIDG